MSREPQNEAVRSRRFDPIPGRADSLGAATRQKNLIFTRVGRASFSHDILHNNVAAPGAVATDAMGSR